MINNIYLYGIKIRCDAHAAKEGNVQSFNFSTNKIDLSSSGKNKEDVIQLILCLPNGAISLLNNDIHNSQKTRQVENLFYIYCESSLDFNHNKLSKLIRLTFPFCCKRLISNRLNMVHKNVFTLLPISKIGDLINVYHSSNYRIERDVFINITSSAVCITNHVSKKGKVSPKNILLANNQLLNTNFADLIILVQPVEYSMMREKLIKEFCNISNIASGFETSPRLLSVLITQQVGGNLRTNNFVDLIGGNNKMIKRVYAN